MLKKTLILVTILVSLLIESAFSVSAVYKTKKIEDNIDDVIDYMGLEEDPIDYKPNVDIKTLEYEQKDQTFTVSLTVKGKIEKRGHLSDFYATEESGDDESGEFNLDVVAYAIEIYTSLNEYYITYVNDECNISTSEGYLEPTSWYAVDRTLKVTFNLQDEDDTLETIAAVTNDIKILSSKWYVDMAPDAQDIETTITAPSKAKVNETVKFTGKAVSDYSDFIWNWTFGDGSTSDKQNPSHKFEKPDTYTVELYVIDGNGNTGYDKFTITIGDTTPKIHGDSTGSINKASSIPPVLTFIMLIAIVAVVGIVVVVYIIKKK